MLLKDQHWLRSEKGVLLVLLECEAVVCIGLAPEVKIIECLCNFFGLSLVFFTFYGVTVVVNSINWFSLEILNSLQLV